jgi:hypothetical protein
MFFWNHFIHSKNEFEHRRSCSMKGVTAVCYTGKYHLKFWNWRHIFCRSDQCRSSYTKILIFYNNFSGFQFKALIRVCINIPWHPHACKFLLYEALILGLQGEEVRVKGQKHTHLLDHTGHWSMLSTAPLAHRAFWIPHKSQDYSLVQYMVIWQWPFTEAQADYFVILLLIYSLYIKIVYTWIFLTDK